MDYKDHQSGTNEEHFWFKAKLELIAILLNKLKITHKPKILSVGVGVGTEQEVLQRFGEVFAIDIDPNVLKLTSDKFVIEKRICDVCNITYPDDSFDLVVAFDVLEHIKNDALAIKEIIRVMRPNGYFIFTVPAFNFLYSSHDRILGHFRRYDKRTLRNLLSALTRIELGYWMSILFIPVAIARVITRNSQSKKVHFAHLPDVVNNVLFCLLKLENWIIKQEMKLPVGTTIYGIYQKNKTVC